MLLTLWSLVNLSAADDASGTVQLVWDTNPEADIAGYRVQYGTASGDLTNSLTVGTSPEATLTQLTPGTYFCAVRAFTASQLEGPLSSEISFDIPQTDQPDQPVEPDPPVEPDQPEEAYFPEIAVHTSGGLQVAAIDFGGLDLGATSAQTFTISNSGNIALTDIALLLDGSQVSNFIVTAPAVTSLAPGESTTFVVAFHPTTEGTHSSALRIASNDPDENPFTIQLAGTGVAPQEFEIPAIAITGPDNTSLTAAADVQDFGGIYLAATGEPRTFTIRNSGTADLTGLSISTDGPAAADFSVSFPSVTSLVPGASATFQVAFQPSTTGTRTAALHIASNAPEMSSFAIPLVGSGIAIPVLALENADGTPLEPATAVAKFGSSILGSTGETVTYIVRNTGTAELTGIQITTTGLRASSYLLDLPSGSSLEPGATLSFNVTFKPAGVGSQPAAIQISSNSTFSEVFKIALDGTGIVVPEIRIYQDDGTALTSGSGVSFGSAHLHSTTAARTFTIKNSGTAKLSGLSVACDEADFNIGTLSSTSLAPGASTTFKVAFQPRAAGTRSAHLVVTSNDADEGTFLIALTGKGIEVPEIVVELGSGRSLTDDDAFINFGTEDVGSTSSSRVFTIRNTGTAKLDGLSIIKNGISPSEFSVTSLKTRSLAPGASTTFKVTFSPSRAAIRWAAIHIASNDADESYFDIVLTGTGSKPSASAPPPPSLVEKTTIPAAPPVSSIEVIGGRKYRTLTIARTPGTTVLPRDVEVSSDLVGWSSGKRHTTVLLDNAKTLKVRDNTPVKPDSKRYIRLKP
ncbi:MAG: choice-of-anchor D domain-containing protein [Verrucomicrobiota bacterium]